MTTRFVLTLRSIVFVFLILVSLVSPVFGEDPKPASPDSVEQAVAALKGPRSSRSVFRAVRIFSKAGDKGIPVLLKGLESTDTIQVEQTFKVLERLLRSEKIDPKKVPQKRVIESAQKGDPKLRAAAVAVAGHLSGPEVARVVVDAYFEEEEALKEGGMQALLGEPKHALKMIMERAKGEDSQRIRALRAVSFFRTEKARRFLLDVATKAKEDMEVREAAFQGIIRFPDGRSAEQDVEVVKTLIPFLDDKKKKVRKEAHMAVRRVLGVFRWKVNYQVDASSEVRQESMKQYEAWIDFQEMLQGLSSTKKSTRLTARNQVIEVLRERPEAEEYIAEYASGSSRSKSVELRRIGVEILGEVFGDGTIETLLDVVVNETVDDIRMSACRFLAHFVSGNSRVGFGDRQAIVESLRGWYIENPKPTLRWELAHLLRQLGDVTPLADIIRSLVGTETDLRKESLLSLSTYPDVAALDAIESLITLRNLVLETKQPDGALEKVLGQDPYKVVPKAPREWELEVLTPAADTQASEVVARRERVLKGLSGAIEDHRADPFALYQVLAVTGTTRALTRLLEYFDSSRIEDRVSVYRALSLCGSQSDSGRISDLISLMSGRFLERLVASKTDEERISLIRLLGRMGVGQKSVIDELVNRSDAKVNSGIRQVAIESLAQLGGDAALIRLRTILKKDSSGSLRLEAARGLIRHDLENAFPLLVSRMGEEKGVEYIRVLSEKSVDLKTEAAAEFYAGLLEHKDGQVRQAALAFFADFAGGENKETDSSGWKSWWDRRQKVDQYLKDLRGKDDKKAGQAIKALVAQGNVGAEHLLPLLHTESGVVFRRLLEVFGAGLSGKGTLEDSLVARFWTAISGRSGGLTDKELHVVAELVIGVGDDQAIAVTGYLVDRIKDSALQGRLLSKLVLWGCRDREDDLLALLSSSDLKFVRSVLGWMEELPQVRYHDRLLGQISSPSGKEEYARILMIAEVLARRGDLRLIRKVTEALTQVEKTDLDSAWKIINLAGGMVDIKDPPTSGSGIAFEATRKTLHNYIEDSFGELESLAALRFGSPASWSEARKSLLVKFHDLDPRSSFIPRLIEILSADGDRSCRIAVLNLLAESNFRDARLVQELDALARDEDLGVAISASRVLRNLAFVGAGQRGDGAIENAAAFSTFSGWAPSWSSLWDRAVKAFQAELAKRLIRLAEDERFGVRFYAIQGLSALDGEDGAKRRSAYRDLLEKSIGLGDTQTLMEVEGVLARLMGEGAESWVEQTEKGSSSVLGMMGVSEGGLGATALDAGRLIRGLSGLSDGEETQERLRLAGELRVLYELLGAKNEEKVRILTFNVLKEFVDALGAEWAMRWIRPGDDQLVGNDDFWPFWRLVEQAILCLSDPEERVRSAAIEFLLPLVGELDSKFNAQDDPDKSKEAIETIQKWLDSEKIRIRTESLMDLVAAGSKKLDGPLKALIEKDSDTVLGVFRRLLKEGSAPVRARAAQEMGRSGDVEDADRLLGLLGDWNADVRKAAFDAFLQVAVRGEVSEWESGKAPSFNVSAELAKRDSEAAAVVDAWTREKEARVTRAQEMERVEQEKERAEENYSILVDRVSSLRGTLLRGVASSDPVIRRVSLRFLGVDRHLKSVQALVAALVDQDLEVRKRAQEGLKRLTGTDRKYDPQASSEALQASREAWSKAVASWKEGEGLAKELDAAGKVAYLKALAVEVGQQREKLVDLIKKDPKFDPDGLNIQKLALSLLGFEGSAQSARDVLSQVYRDEESIQREVVRVLEAMTRRAGTEDPWKNHSGPLRWVQRQRLFTSWISWIDSSFKP